jgi:hypothetical protein
MDHDSQGHYQQVIECSSCYWRDWQIGNDKPVKESSAKESGRTNQSIPQQAANIAP